MANNKYKILLIEDDPTQIMMYRAQFEIDGFKVFDAKNYIDTEKIIVNDKPDIILLDLVLGAEKGEDILKKLKQKKIIDKIPLFIFSNLRSDKDEEMFVKLGAKGFWAKTKYLPGQLSKKIKDYLKSES